MTPMLIHTPRAILQGAFAVLLAAIPASAVDLSVAAVAVNQQIQTGTTTLVGGRPTWLRVTVETGGENVAGVDGVLHVITDGVPGALSPHNSINGPFTARSNPNLLEENDTLNFFFMAPISDNVDLIIEINPPGVGQIEETNFANNLAVAGDQVFECRRIPELVYVPVDYRPGGGGGENVPDPEMIDSNIGAGFVRGIFPVPDWNYHEWPMPPLLLTQDINGGGNTVLLNQLSQIRTQTLPNAGFPTADYIYGWLAGNPFGGNGQANGIPGDAAFGNTDATRHQRTFAHELGHLFGMVHVGNTTGTIGVDVEHHLAEPLNLGRIKSSTLRTIMVAGLLTPQAWIGPSNYEHVASWPTVQCTQAADAPPRAIHVTGILDNRTGEFELDPIFEVTQKPATPGAGDANLTLEVYSAGNDAPIRSVGVNTRAAADRCDAPDEQYETSPFSVVVPIPNEQGASGADRIVIRDTATGQILAERVRTPNAPAVSFARPGFGAVLNGMTTITWTASDTDRDALTYNLLYSYDDGGSWYVLALNLNETTYDLDPDAIAGSAPGAGRLRVVATDGMNVAVGEVGHLTLGGQNPPHVEIVYPNDGDTFVALTPIFFHGTNWDAEDLVIPDLEMEWSSDRDGVFAHGRLLQYDVLTIGSHTLTLTVSDNDGMIGTDSIDIEILNRNIPQTDCNGNGKPDLNDILDGVSDDCDRNRFPDECDIENGDLHDVNNNGAPDECEGLADFDGDGDRDAHDFSAFLDCVTGPDGEIAPGCEPADLDGDGDADFADYGLFSIIVDGDCNVTILEDPQPTAACGNDQVTFEVVAVGTQLNYQWLFNGQQIAGANQAILVLNSVSPADAGIYSALVFNPCGVETSAGAELLVAEPPVITEQPASTSVCLGDPAFFAVEAIGAPPLSYQWQRNGVDIPGGVFATLVIPSVGEENLGLYKCIVTDSCPSSTTSDIVQLSLEPAVVFTIQPQGGDVCVGGSIFLVSSADGANSYQWFKDGEIIPNETNFFLSIGNVTTEDSGDYHVVATGDCDSAPSDIATINVITCDP